MSEAKATSPPQSPTLHKDESCSGDIFNWELPAGPSEPQVALGYTNYLQQGVEIHREPPQTTSIPSDNVRSQRIRFSEDLFTPRWVRKNGATLEGWCGICPDDGQWLVIRNDRYWLHRQFDHGISSTTGLFFLPPVETRRTATHNFTQGLCHSCGEWVPYNRGLQIMNPRLWFRHAHTCHVYHSPAPQVPVSP